MVLLRIGQSQREKNLESTALGKRAQTATHCFFSVLIRAQATRGSSQTKESALSFQTCCRSIEAGEPL